MTQEEIQAIRERLSDATPGPWTAQGLGSEGYVIEVRLPGETAPDTYDRIGFYGRIAEVRAGRRWKGLRANAEFIAHAPEDMRRLLAEVERLREPVRWFAGKMEEALQRNDHKGGWQNEYLWVLLHRIDEELAELYKAAFQIEHSGPLENVIKEAADVANFAMMIADVARQALEGGDSL